MPCNQKLIVMKKTLTIAIMLLFAIASVSAKDVIITRDGKKIECYVVKTNSKGVEYRTNNPDNGPIFELTNDEAATITFESGEVYVFQTSAPETVKYGSLTPEIDSDGLPKPIEGMAVRRESDDAYYMGSMKMDEEQFERFLQRNCTPAYERFRTGVKLKRTGWALFGVGIGMTISGVALVASGVRYYKVTSKSTSIEVTEITDPVNRSLYIPGAIFLSFGSAALTASIPLLCVGIHKKDHAYETYNEQCTNRQAYSHNNEVRLNLSASHNGLGFSLNF